MSEADLKIIKYIQRARLILAEVIYDFNPKYSPNQPLIIEVAKMLQKEVESKKLEG